MHPTFPVKPSSEWKFCLLFKLLILVRESECKEADFSPSILPSIQTVLKHTFQFSHKCGTITIHSLQGILPFTAVPHAHLSLGWKKEKGRILCTVSQLRHQVEREHCCFQCNHLWEVARCGENIALAHFPNLGWQSSHCSWSAAFKHLNRGSKSHTFPVENRYLCL